MAASWIAERRAKNKPCTVYAKECHYANFIKHLATITDMAAFDKAEVAGFKKREQDQSRERAQTAGKSFRKIPDAELGGMFVATKTAIESLNKQSVVAFKDALSAKGQKAKTVDNKLLTLSDFFEYAIGNGAYKSPDGTPVSGTLILTKRERTDQAEPYKPFTDADFMRIFEPAAYKSNLHQPDFYWCPLIGIYTGMRISEVTGIYCDDAFTSSNGVDIIHVRKSKSGAGIRDVPIAKALIDLGFLDFVFQQRAAGHERLFPERQLINDSYSKELSDAFRGHLIAVGVRRSADKSERKSFHSFRVNVITQLADNGANTVQSMRIVGHATPQGARGLGTHLGYVRELPSLKAIVDSLTWPINLARPKV